VDPKVENKIEELRDKIDTIDNELLKLINRRLMLTREIGEVKKENHLNIVDMPREKAMFDALEEKCHKLGLDKRIISTIWQEILKASYRSQE
jgi:chorismate mutase